MIIIIVMRIHISRHIINTSAIISAHVHSGRSRRRRVIPTSTSISISAIVSIRLSTNCNLK